MNKKTRTRLMVFTLIPILLFTAIFAILCTTIIFPKPATAMGLGLDPENDPTVFTTTSGLEIKKSNGQITSSVATVNNINVSYTQNLSGFYYFTMGTYSGTIYTGKSLTDSYTLTNEPINWIILGRGEKLDLTLDEDSSHAGQAIKNDTNAALREFYGDLPDSVTYNSEIPAGCVLVISEKLLGNMYFNSTGAVNTKIWTEATQYSHQYVIYGIGDYGTRYRYYADTNSKTPTWTIANNKGGDLYNAVNALFSKNASTGAVVKNALNFTAQQAKLIRPQQLKTAYHNGSKYLLETPSTDGGTYYTMFPLAYSGANSAGTQNFCIETYLTTNQQRVATLLGSNISYFYWLRSGGAAGDDAWLIKCDGRIEADEVNGGDGIRPAFVMEFTPNLI